MKQSAEAQVIKPRRWRVAWKSRHRHQDPCSGNDPWFPCISAASPWVTNGPTEVGQEFGVQNYPWCKQAQVTTLIVTEWVPPLGFRAVGGLFRCVSGCPRGKEPPVSPSRCTAPLRTAPRHLPAPPRAAPYSPAKSMEWPHCLPSNPSLSKVTSAMIPTKKLAVGRQLLCQDHRCYTDHHPCVASPCSSPPVPHHWALGCQFFWGSVLFVL